MLTNAGKVIPNMDSMDFSAYKGIAVSEYQKKAGFADYVLSSIEILKVSSKLANGLNGKFE